MTKQVVSLSVENSIACIKIDHPPVNALSHSVRSKLLDAFEQLRKDERVKAVVLVGAGRCFVAGADIKEFDHPPTSPLLPDICNMIEGMRCPVVASMHGVSLGGGLEIALAAHHRIAQPDSAMGLPEVRIGLISGAGGTQRLPRLVGADMAVDMITTGRRVTADEAVAAGLLDHVIEGDPGETGIAFAQRLLLAGQPLRRTSDLASPEPANWTERADAVEQKARGQIAPVEALRAVQASSEMSFSEGLRLERQIFDSLMKTDQRDALVHAFFAERAAQRSFSSYTAKPLPIESIGVVGGGTMGAGIATSALLAGLKVTLVEQDDVSVAKARGRIAENLESAGKRFTLPVSDVEAFLSERLSVSNDWDTLTPETVVIEAVFEEFDAKQNVFSRLDDICARDAVLATNTSYLDVAEIATATTNPGRVIGLHFFSPAHKMKLLEVVVPEGASSIAVATGNALGRKLGKIPVWSGVCEGFIGNRILHACRTAADHMVLDGASPFKIDEAIKSLGYPMGPFQVSDLAGLDIGWAMRKRRAKSLHALERVGRYPDVLCDAGHFGQKTGKGFYVYSNGKRVGVPNPEMEDIIQAERIERGIEPRVFEVDEIQQRYLAAMVNEAAKILSEGIARRPSDVDVVLLAGYGFPRHLGGPCKWADQKGLLNVLDDINHFAHQDDYFWRPAALLEELVTEGKFFDDLNNCNSGN